MKMPISEGVTAIRTGIGFKRFGIDSASSADTADYRGSLQSTLMLWIS